MVTTGTTTSNVGSVSIVRDYSELELPIFSWPELDPKALYGLAGEVVSAGVYTNVEPAGLLISFLTAVGTCLSDTGLLLRDDYHPARLFSVLVGNHGARKGAWEHSKKLFKKHSLNIDDWPLEMGDDFIRAIVEEEEEEPAPKLRALPSLVTKHMLLTVDDFGRTLRAARHVRNPLATMLSSAYDNDHLKLLTQKRERIDGCKVNVCLLGQISMHELRDSMPKESRLAGLINRILWVALRQRPRLATEITENSEEINSLSELLSIVLSKRSRKLKLSQKALAHWKESQERIIFQQAPGFATSLAEKTEAHILRMATIYAVLDETSTILPEHLDAATAVWHYCKASAQIIFGENKTGTLARKILVSLAKGNKTQSEITREVFARNVDASVVSLVLADLASLGLISSMRTGGGFRNGQPITTWSLADKNSVDSLFSGEQ
jgi:hypothetical protein